MCALRRKPKDDQVREWLCILQEKNDLNAEEARELYSITCTCFAHNFEEAKVQCVINNYLKSLGRRSEKEDTEPSGIFTYRAGSRRYGKWSWQENAFGIVAYLLTTFLFLIDSITFAWEPAIVALNQFLAVLVVLIIWLLLDSWLRNRPWTVVLFNAVNRFMPGLTLVTYMPFHLCKMAFLSGDGIGWLFGMKATVVVYVVLGILLTIINLMRYRKAVNLVK